MIELIGLLLYYTHSAPKVKPEDILQAGKEMRRYFFQEREKHAGLFLGKNTIGNHVAYRRSVGGELFRGVQPYLFSAQVPLLQLPPDPGAGDAGGTCVEERGNTGGGKGDSADGVVADPGARVGKDAANAVVAQKNRQRQNQICESAGAHLRGCGKGERFHKHFLRAAGIQAVEFIGGNVEAGVFSAKRNCLDDPLIRGVKVRADLITAGA